MLKKGYYSDKSDGEIKRSIEDEGFSPLIIKDSPGFVYELHSHPATKLLAILSGSMEVQVNGEPYSLHPGDRFVIPGNSPHSALVGNEGCVFFWSEKITRDK